MHVWILGDLVLNSQPPPPRPLQLYTLRGCLHKSIRRREKLKQPSCTAWHYVQRIVEFDEIAQAETILLRHKLQLMNLWQFSIHQNNPTLRCISAKRDHVNSPQVQLVLKHAKAMFHIHSSPNQ